MIKWKRELDIFTVKPYYDDRRGRMAVIPKPILGVLGYTMAFSGNRGKITIQAGKK